MSQSSRIEWTEATWNPVTGCSKVSPGCAHCYAERTSRRLQAMGCDKYAQGFNPVVHEGLLSVPLAWKAPRRVFVNSMSDLFHESVPDDFVLAAFDVMRQAHWHTFQVLTKRPARLYLLHHLIAWSPNVWMGVSVETASYQERVDVLRQIGARVRFVSYEPLLGPMGDVDLRGIHWVIVGGESGPNARPMLEDWVLGLRDQCVEAGIPFFFKQWGGGNKQHTGRMLQGRTWDEIPATPNMDGAVWTGDTRLTR